MDEELFEVMEHKEHKEHKEQEGIKKNQRKNNIIFFSIVNNK